MNIDVIEKEDDFLMLRSEWNALLKKVRPHSPFLRHEWIASWWQAFGSESKLHVLRFREAGRTLAFLPLRVARSSQFGVPLSTLSFLANSHSNETGFVPARPEAAIYAEFMQYLRKNKRKWDLVFLELLNSADPFVSFAKRTFQLQDFYWGTKPSIGSPVIELPYTFEEYLGALSRKSRYGVRKKKRMIEAVPGYEIREYEDGWHLADFWRQMERIEKNSWKFKEHKDLFSRPDVRKFYRLLLRAMAEQGFFRGFVLFLQSKPVAYEMAFEYEGELYSQKIAYDASWSRMSPGYVLKTEVIRWAIKKGLVKNHLLGDVESWKLQLNGRLQPHLHLKLYSPHMRSRIVAKAEFEGIRKLGNIKRSLIKVKRTLL